MTFTLRKLAVTLSTSAVLISSSAGSAKREAEKQVVRDVTASFSDCVVKKNPMAARAVISDMIPAREVKRRYRVLINVDCMGHAVSGSSVMGVNFGDPTFYFAVAEALVRYDYGASGPQDFKSVPALVYQDLDSVLSANERSKLSKSRSEKYAQIERQVTAIRVLFKYCECVARSDPEGSRLLVVKGAGSPEERLAFNRLLPNLGKCLPNGLEIKFKTDQLRGAIAVNYFRLAHAIRPIGNTVGEVKS